MFGFFPARRCVLAIAFLFIIMSQSSFSAPLKYELQVEITSLKQLTAIVKISFSKESHRKMSFYLNKNLKPRVLSQDDQIQKISESKEGQEIEWGLALGSSDSFVVIEYSGMLDEMNASGELGVQFLAEQIWYPFFYNFLLTYDLTVKIPSEWKVHNQGNIIAKSKPASSSSQTVQFKQIYPQEAINLIVGPYFEYSDSSKDTQFKVWLRKEDKALAQGYLNLIPGYIKHFSDTLGKYPFNQMVVIENFEETGYGLPSFTLLGPTVIRLPFILYSSLPHEILHNWWGNGVFVDYSSGNWSEGLTTYLSDHWQQEVAQNDARYRQDKLIGFKDFVQEDLDFPLKDFKSRHSESTQAVGYNKGMMFFHMLRITLGDEVFFDSLRDFYQNQLYREASYADLQSSFEKVSRINLERFFSQWVNEVGAPSLSIKDPITQLQEDGSYSTTFVLQQTQPSHQYELSVPVELFFANGKVAKNMVSIKDRETKITISSHRRPLKISVDRSFDVFRDIYPEERPVTLSQIVGARHITVVKANNEDPYLDEVIGFLKNILSAQLTVVSKWEDWDDRVNGSTIFVGDHPMIRKKMMELLKKENFSVSDEQLKLEETQWEIKDISFLIAARSNIDVQNGVFWFKGNGRLNDENMISRMVHYNKWGNLIFKNTQFVYKNNWKTDQSPLTQDLKLKQPQLQPQQLQQQQQQALSMSNKVISESGAEAGLTELKDVNDVNDIKNVSEMN